MKTKVKSLNDAVIDRMAEEMANEAVEEAEHRIRQSRAGRVLFELDPVLAEDVFDVAEYFLDDEVRSELFDCIRGQIVDHPGGVQSFVAQVAVDLEGAAK